LGKFTSLCTSSPTTHPQGVAIIPEESLAKLTMPMSRWCPLHGCREDTHKVAQSPMMSTHPHAAHTLCTARHGIHSKVAREID
jgi:hypothetical protein